VPLLRTLPARARALPPYRLDALIAAVVAVELTLEILILSEVRGSDRVLALLLAIPLAVGVALRRRAPLAAILLTVSALPSGELIGDALTDHLASPYFCVLLVSYTAGMRLEGVRLAVAFVLCASLTVLGVAVDDYPDELANFIFSITLVAAAPMLFGQLMRSRSRLNRALREKAARAEAEHARRAEAAALEERTRIAGELHDVVAHALSAMTIQATAARRLAERDPQRAGAAFAAVEGTGREALTELRRLLGVLRKEDEELALAPQPSLVHIGALARRTQAAGLPVRVSVSGTPRALPAGVDLTAYRVVQEALGRARDAGHAGRAEVRVAYGAEYVRVEVTDDGVASGRRLLGMRERVAVYGGQLSTAVSDGGGWTVSARLPVEARP
jgi:signal transduction histidine kinase